MKIFNEREKSALKSAFLEYAKELPCDEDLQDISFTDGLLQRMKKTLKRQRLTVVYRAVALCACLAVIVTAIGFFAKPQNIPTVTPPQDSSENDMIILTPTIDNMGHWANDIFVATITSSPKKTEWIVDHHTDDFDYPDNITPTLCTAKVTDSILSTVVTENTEIKLYNNVCNNEKYYSNKFEKGKTYLIGGEAYRHGNSVSIECNIIAELDGQTLLPQTKVTKQAFEGINTLTHFKENEHIKALIEREKHSLLGFAYVIIKDKDRFYTIDGDYDYYLEHVKKAIQVGGPNNFYRVEQSEFGDSLIYDSTEIFTAKIVKEVGKVNGEFENKQGKIPIMYHVEVQNTYLAQLIDKNTTIRYIYFADDEDDRLKVDKEYLLSGISEPFEQKIAVIGSDKVFARIEDGRLYDRCDALKKIKTVKKLDMWEIFIETETYYGGGLYTSTKLDKAPYFVEFFETHDDIISNEEWDTFFNKVKNMLKV